MVSNRPIVFPKLTWSFLLVYFLKNIMYKTKNQLNVIPYFFTMFINKACIFTNKQV